VITPDEEPASNASPVASSPRRLTIEIGLGPGFARYADLGGTAFPHGYGLVSYALAILNRADISAGIRFGGWGDSWSNTSGVTNAPPGCLPALPQSFSAAELTVHALAALGMRVHDRVRAALTLGFGVAGTTAGARVGGDLYEPSCVASQSPQPSFHGSLDISFRALPWLRPILHPIVIDLHPNYDGARSQARGVWMRIGFTAGVAFDL
jgi:hypothetical protein